MSYRYFGDVRMELDWRIAFLEFEDLGIVIDRGRERHDYAVHTFSCMGEFMGIINIMTWSNERVPCGVQIDTRSLLLLRAKCCPLELGGAILEG